jgi:hypothetical protein
MIAFMLVAALATAPVALPDPNLTPGVVRELTLAQVCTTKWGRDHRFVTSAMKAAVFRRYGYSGNEDPRCAPDKHGRRCEIDHLVSRELGGADDVRNLWPEPYLGPLGASAKDRTENRLHVLVCQGSISLQEAQDAIRTDWVAAYAKYVGPIPK